MTWLERFAHRAGRGIPSDPILKLRMLVQKPGEIHQETRNVMDENRSIIFGDADHLGHPLLAPLKIFPYFQPVAEIRGVLLREIERWVGKSDLRTFVWDCLNKTQAVPQMYFVEFQMRIHVTLQNIV
jgi:hypothetical protein